MAKLDSIPLDIYRHHILPFIRNPCILIALGAINHKLRHKWTKLESDILKIAENRIPSLEKVIKDTEESIQVDKTPNLSRNLYQAGVDAHTINFMELDYEDEMTLILLGVALSFIKNLSILPHKDEIISQFRKHKFIYRLEHLNVRKISKSTLNLVQYIMDEQL